MQLTLTLTPLALLLSLVSAQSYSLVSSTSACAAQPVLEACIASTQAIVQSCASTDYNCLCQKWTDVLTCFLQCPNDPRSVGTSSSKATFCNDASAYPSSTSSAISRAVSAAFSAATTGASTAGSGAVTGSSGAVKVASITGSGSEASGAASTTAKSGAMGREVVNGGWFLGLVGLVGALL